MPMIRYGILRTGPSILDTFYYLVLRNLPYSTVLIITSSHAMGLTVINALPSKYYGTM